eukprot:scaffold4973_cov135-Cylindrotheca_fusiformis.AAC.27
MRFLSALNALLVIFNSREVEGSQSLEASLDPTTKKLETSDTTNPPSPPPKVVSNATTVRKQTRNKDYEVAVASYSNSTTMSWVEAATFPMLEASGYGGNRLSISGDGTFLAAAPFSNTNNGNDLAGIVRFFQKQELDGTSWKERTDLRLFGSSDQDSFGTDVSLSYDGKRVAIGAIRDDDCNNNVADSGSVSVYEMDTSNAEWSLMGEVIHGESAFDFSGWSVALSNDGTTVAIGARFNNDNGDSSGHVRVYQWNGSSFNQLGEDIDGEAEGDHSGTSVALSSDGLIVAIGAQYNDGISGEFFRTGHVRVYYWDENEDDWLQRGSDIDGDAVCESFGFSVDLSDDGNILAVGARWGNYAKVFQWNNISNHGWDQIGQTLEGTAESLGFGTSVSLSSSGSILAVGSLNYDSSCSPIMVFTLANNRWEGLAGGVGSFPGLEVSLSSDGTTIAVGHPESGGHVRVYHLLENSSTSESTSSHVPCPMTDESFTSQPGVEPADSVPPSSVPILDEPSSGPTSYPPTLATPTTDGSNAGDEYSVLCSWYTTVIFAFILLL